MGSREAARNDVADRHLAKPNSVRTLDIMKRRMTLIANVLSLRTALLALVVFTVPSLAASFPEPIARAADGQLQCYSPDKANKTCSALASFAPGKERQIITTAVILISTNPLIIMKGTASVLTRSGELCGVLSEQNIEDASFSDGNDALDSTQGMLLRKVMEVSLQNVFGHEVCGSYVAKGATLFAQAKLDGEPMSGAAQRVTWVAPADGYRVGP